MRHLCVCMGGREVVHDEHDCLFGCMRCCPTANHAARTEASGGAATWLCFFQAASALPHHARVIVEEQRASNGVHDHLRMRMRTAQRSRVKMR